MRPTSWLLASICSSCLCASVASADEVIRFRELWGFGVAVPVAVGDSGTHELLLDTGSSSTILEPRLAAELGVVPIARTHLVTAAGRRTVGVGRVSLGLGRVRLRDVEVLIAELPAIRGDEPGVRGILGQSALGRLDYTIDHARRRLVVHREGPPRTAADRAGLAVEAAARPVLEARPGCGRSVVRLVLDSGIARPVLFERAGRRLDVAVGGSVRVATNVGDAVWREGRLASLCVGERRSGAVSVVLGPPTAPPRAEDGLLPSRYFARVHLGLAASVVAVEPW